MRTTFFAGVAPLVFASTIALAQGAPTDTGNTAPTNVTPAPTTTTTAVATPTATATPPPKPPTAAPPTAAPPSSPNELPPKDAPASTEERSDHETVVHHLAVGYLGVSQIPVAEGNVTGLAQGTVSAPVLGVRYWFHERVGLDLGVGLGVTGASTSSTIGGTSTSNNSPAVVGFGLHAGVPLALAHSKHFTFEIIPEVDFGYAGTKVTGTGGTTDAGLNGVRLDVGGRIGAELQMGFIGIPQLSLQGTIGLSFRYTTVWASRDADSANLSTITLGTTFQNDPWAIFTNSVAALYYF